MNKIITLILLLLCGNRIFGQSQFSFVVQKWDIESPYIESIAFVRFDSTSVSQSTVLEYKNFVLLLDLPAISSSLRKEKNFEKETEFGSNFLSFIEEYYNKSIKSVFVSHWHAHSISGIVPFLEKGVNFYITPHNWHEALRDGVLPIDYSKADYEKRIRFIDKDTVLLSESNFPIEVLYMDYIKYSGKPTKDYLVYYLPRISTLHASCKVLIKEIDHSKYATVEYSDRLLDIQKVIREKNLTVNNVIRLYFSKSPNFVIPYRQIEDIIRNGKSWNEMIEYFVNMDLSRMQQNQDSLLRYAIETKLHPSLLRLAVYECIKQKQFAKAVTMAQNLCNYKPNNAFYINALGESYYNMGEHEVAMYYDAFLKTMSNEYGIEQWKKNSIKTN